MRKATGENPKVVALILAASVVALMVLMQHHPVPDVGPDRAAAIAQVSALGKLVHGFLIAALLLLFHAMQRVSGYLVCRGKDFQPGMLMLACSLAGFIVAASVNGFIMPDLAQLQISGDDPDENAYLLLSGALYLVNQYSSTFGSIGAGMALVLWSTSLLSGAVGSRMVAIPGLLLGTAILLSMGLGIITLNLAGMTTVVMMFSLWFLMLAVWLYRVADKALESGQ